MPKPKAAGRPPARESQQLHVGNPSYARKSVGLDSDLFGILLLLAGMSSTRQLARSSSEQSVSIEEQVALRLPITVSLR